MRTGSGMVGDQRGELRFEVVSKTKGKLLCTMGWGWSVARGNMLCTNDSGSCWRSRARSKWVGGGRRSRAKVVRVVSGIVGDQGQNVMQSGLGVVGDQGAKVVGAVSKTNSNMSC